MDTVDHRPTRLALTGGWLFAGAVLLRFWDLTIRFEAFLLWTAVFVALYAASVAVLRRRGLLLAPNPWADVWLWCAILMVATVVQFIFPHVVLADRTVQTAALLRVFDIVLPLWILHRAIHASWPGRLGVALTAATPIYLLAVLWVISIRMPGESFTGVPPQLTIVEQEIRERSERHVRHLSDSIGSRGFRGYPEVQATVAYLRGELESYGYDVVDHSYVASEQDHTNLAVTIPGNRHAEEIVVVGAHYDTYDLTPGADDNATGVAGVLELARLMVDHRPERTLRFVLFGTEEPPFFNTDAMGSRVYAGRARQGDEKIVAMYSLEMLGYFSEESGSQHHPQPLALFFPSKGNFIAFVGNLSSGSLLRRSLARFREVEAAIPSEGLVSSSLVPGVELSDHASFWRYGFPAVLVSDTGPFRNLDYHLATETADQLDFARMARVVAGVMRVVEAEAGVADNQPPSR